MKGYLDRKQGLEGFGPLTRRNSTVHVACRPVDPLIEDRIEEMVSEIKTSGNTIPPDMSLAVRCIDGFYTTGKGYSLLSDRPTLIRVIEYDPVQNISLVVGEDEPDTLSPIYWYCFRTFEDTGAILCIKDPDKIEFDHIGSNDGKIEMMLDMMRKWKGSPSLVYRGLDMFRSRTLKDIRSYILDRFSTPHDRSQRS